MSRVLQNYGNQVTQGYHSSHHGIDLIGSHGGTDYVVAHSAGTVTAAVSGYGNRQGSSGMTAYGNYVDVTHTDGSFTRYAHLQYVSVSKGKKVNSGDVLGYMGNTGNSYGAHLHFEYWNASGVRSDPTPYIDADLPGLNSSTTANSSKAKAEKETKDITKVVVKSVEGSTAQHSTGNLTDTKMLSAGVEILIQNGDKIMLPCVKDDITLESHRKGSPAVLKFSCVKDSNLNFQEGNAVSLRVNKANVFYGYIFEKKHSSDMPVIQVTCYDQLRYFKNKDTYIYTNKKYSDLIRMLVGDFHLALGTIEDTGYPMSRAEETTLFDICGNASDETVLNTGKVLVQTTW
ncbi:M23 family metallopeptidase [Scatolibacter rhodanostii]|uniref:M23 family metallopeptidase n=1 Tax=Scatolibacter rhodanostii TaxID=2014781 RepID=UPI000C0883E5|nr:M23 family metallopeptidase [Scatolibacter rhodanostii]